MNDDTINDLKQFIAAAISQQTSDIVERLDKADERLYGIDSRLDSVEQKIDDLAQSVAEALDSSNESTGAQLKNHEKRIIKLEQRSA